MCDYCKKYLLSPNVAQLTVCDRLICQCGWYISCWSIAGKRGNKGIKKRRQFIRGFYQVMGLSEIYFQKNTHERIVSFSNPGTFDSSVMKNTLPDRKTPREELSDLSLFQYGSLWFQGSLSFVDISFLLLIPRKITGWLDLSHALFVFYFFQESLGFWMSLLPHGCHSILKAQRPYLKAHTLSWYSSVDLAVPSPHHGLLLCIFVSLFK